MKPARKQPTSLRHELRKSSDSLGRRALSGHAGSVRLSDVLAGTSLGGRLAELSGRSVMLLARDQLTAALAMIELDGVARRMILCSPELAPEHVPLVMAAGDVDAIVADEDSTDTSGFAACVRVAGSRDLIAAPIVDLEPYPTEWVLLTSGTTGVPKLVAHTLATLASAIRHDGNAAAEPVWATFYDIRRYGGLQIFLRAILGGGSLVLSSADETPAQFLARLAAHGATHISGTPSHWRRALMNPLAREMAPQYVRLSGEIADQAILNALCLVYPHARIDHAFASTEAGVGFVVTDGREGVPADVFEARGDVTVKIEGGSLRIRSAGVASRYLGEHGGPIPDEEGFVDTGDMVERRGDRYCFLGRRSGVINIGGQKVYPEEIEAVINRHPAVRVSNVRPKKSPITGSLVAADVVLRTQPGQAGNEASDLKREILEICHGSLAAYKVPATIRFVPALDLSPAGKLARDHA